MLKTALVTGALMMGAALLSPARAESLAGCSFAAVPADDACATAARQRLQCRNALGQLTPAFGPEVGFMLSECQRCAGVYLTERCAMPSPEAQWPVPDGMPTPASGFTRDLALPADLGYAPAPVVNSAPASPASAPQPPSAPPAPPLPTVQPEAAPEPDFFDLLFEP